MREKNKKSRVLFRADSWPSIGCGDLISLIHLSQWFSLDKWDVFFACRKTLEAQRVLQARNLESSTFWLTNGSLETEKTEFFSLVSELEPDVIFYELTWISMDQYGKIPDCLCSVVVSFDGKLCHQEQIVWNWDVCAQEKFLDLSKDSGVKFFLGPQFTPLPGNRNHFSSKIVSRDIDLLVTMGGADENNDTLQVLKAVMEKNKPSSLSVILGNGFHHRKEVDFFLGTKKGNVRIYNDLSDIQPLLRNSKKVICAGGLTVAEAISCGCDVYVIATHQHQIPRCQWYEEHAGIHFGGFRVFDPERIKNFLSSPAVISRFEFKTIEVVGAVEEFVFV